MTAQTLTKAGTSASPQEPPTWRAELATAFRQGDELLRFLDLEDRSCGEAAEQFPCLVPRAFAERMNRGDRNDPLLRQVLPIDAEMDVVPGFEFDPLAETSSQCAAGLLRKYKNRALLVCTGACAIHCRYCFRRHYDYTQTPSGAAWWSEALTFVQSDNAIDEVILSGGDPLLLPTNQLQRLIHDIAQIKHVKRLRIHTRIPIVLPSRITEAFIALLESSALPVVVVVHANHAREIDAAVKQACQRMRKTGVHLLNQSVLLKGVNDSAKSLIDLSQVLFDAGIMPYYVHQLDKVAGTAHFAVADEDAQEIMRSLQKELSGYLLPRLVREVPGTDSKQPLHY